MRMLALGDDRDHVAVALAGTFGAHRADPGELMLWALPTLPVWILLFKLYKLYDRYAGFGSATPRSTCRGWRTACWSARCFSGVTRSCCR